MEHVSHHDSSGPTAPLYGGIDAESATHNSSESAKKIEEIVARLDPFGGAQAQSSPIRTKVKLKLSAVVVAFGICVLVVACIFPATNLYATAVVLIVGGLILLLLTYRECGWSLSSPLSKLQISAHEWKVLQPKQAPHAPVLERVRESVEHTKAAQKITQLTQIAAQNSVKYNLDESQNHMLCTALVQKILRVVTPEAEDSQPFSTRDVAAVARIIQARAWAQVQETREQAAHENALQHLIPRQIKLVEARACPLPPDATPFLSVIQTAEETVTEQLSSPERIRDAKHEFYKALLKNEAIKRAIDSLKDMEQCEIAQSRDLKHVQGLFFREDLCQLIADIKQFGGEQRLRELLEYLPCLSSNNLQITARVCHMLGNRVEGQEKSTEQELEKIFRERMNDVCAEKAQAEQKIKRFCEECRQPSKGGLSQQIAKCEAKAQKSLNNLVTIEQINCNAQSSSPQPVQAKELEEKLIRDQRISKAIGVDLDVGIHCWGQPIIRTLIFLFLPEEMDSEESSVRDDGYPTLMHALIHKLSNDVGEKDVAKEFFGLSEEDASSAELQSLTKQFKIPCKSDFRLRQFSNEDLMRKIARAGVMSHA